MILIGQYDSPFVRRVAIALVEYGLPYEHEPWSVWADAERLAAYNPLRRVPVLVLDGGECLVESSAILDALDEQVGPARALLPRSGAERRAGLRVCSLATGLADKAVSRLYEHVLRPEAQRSALWLDRCDAQIRAVLGALEAERAGRPGPWWLGERLSHADVAVGCALRFLGEAHPDLYRPAEWPALAGAADACEARPSFRRVVQPLKVELRPSSE